jgi:hypothetical protein
VLRVSYHVCVSTMSVILGVVIDYKLLYIINTWLRIQCTFCSLVELNHLHANAVVCIEHLSPFCVCTVVGTSATFHRILLECCVVLPSVNFHAFAQLLLLVLLRVKVNVVEVVIWHHRPPVFTLG